MSSTVSLRKYGSPVWRSGVTIVKQPDHGDVRHLSVMLAELNWKLPMSEINMSEEEENNVKTSSTVLLVEPDPDFRDSTCELLEVFDYRVVTASNLEKALLVCAQVEHKLDCLIVSAYMPRSTGLEVLNALHGVGCRIPALLYSVFAANEQILTHVATGKVIFLPMPFLPDDFRRTVIEAIGLAPMDSCNEHRTFNSSS